MLIANGCSSVKKLREGRSSSLALDVAKFEMYTIIGQCVAIVCSLTAPVNIANVREQLLLSL